MIEPVSGVANGIKLLSEVVIPGASQFIDGKVGSGIGHLLVAGAAAALLAPSAPILATVAAFGIRLNSFSSSVNNESLASQAVRLTSCGSSALSAPVVTPTPAAPTVENHKKV